MKTLSKTIQIPRLFFALVAVITVMIPLYNTNYDHWDGMIIDHAIRSKDFSGVYNWWKECAYHAFILWTYPIEFLSNILSPKATRVLHSTVTFIFLLNALYSFFQTISFSSKKHAMLLASLIGITISPFFYSSIFTPMLFSLSLSLYGVVLTSLKKTQHHFLGLILLVLGMSYFHALPLIILSSSYIYSYRKSKSLSLRDVTRYFIPFSIIISFLFIIIYKVIWKSNGLYSQYSAFSFSLKLFLLNIKNALLYSPIILSSLILTAYVFKSKTKQKKFFRRNNSTSIISLVLLLSIVANILIFTISKKIVPFYLLVNFFKIEKCTHYRYLIPFFITFMVLSSIYIEKFKKDVSKKLVFLHIPIILVCFIFSIQKWRFNFQSDQHKTVAISYFSKINLEENIICFHAKDSPLNKYPSVYQNNYLHSLAGKGLLGQTCLTNRNDQCLSIYKTLCSSSKPEYASKYIFSPQICKIVETQKSVSTCRLIK